MNYRLKKKKTNLRQVISIAIMILNYVDGNTVLGKLLSDSSVFVTSGKFVNEIEKTWNKENMIFFYVNDLEGFGYSFKTLRDAFLTISN